MFRQLRIALMFYSRIPVGSIPAYQPDELKAASIWLPIIGVLLAVILTAFYFLLSPVLPRQILLILLLILSVLLTGAFHEDGFADTWDGLGGGWSKEQKLQIMKDSRLGTYGAVALILLILLKYQLWLAIPAEHFAIGLITSMTISRFAPLLLINLLSYVRDTDQSKARPIAQGLGANWVYKLLFQVAIYSIALLFWADWQLIGLIWLSLLFTVAGWRWFLLRQIEGYTGDTLGAGQQLSELSLLLVVVAWLN